MKELSGIDMKDATLAQLAEVARQVVDAWRNGEFGPTESGILGAPTYVQAAVVGLADFKDFRMKDELTGGKKPKAP